MSDSRATFRVVDVPGGTARGLPLRVVEVESPAAGEDLAAPRRVVLLTAAEVAEYDLSAPMQVRFVTEGAEGVSDYAEPIYVVLSDADGVLIASFLASDEFNDTDANPLAARTGMTISDTGNNLSTDGQRLVAAGGETNWGDTSIYFTDSFARSALGGVGTVARIPVNAGSMGLFLTSALDPDNPLTADKGIYYNYPDLRVAGVTATTRQRPGTRLYMVDYLLAAFPRPGGGCFYVASGGQFGDYPDGRIVWVDDDDSTDPVFAGLANGSGVHRFDWLRALDPDTTQTFATARFAQALGAFTFGTDAADADGYVSETGAKALDVWTGTAETTGGVLQTTGGTMRARFDAGGEPHVWKATFVAPATVTGREIYIDFRDNGTSRFSAVLDTSSCYIFDGYASSTLSTTGAVTLQASTTYHLTVFDYPTGECVFFVNDVERISTTGANGLGETMGGVTTVGAGITVDDVACWPLSIVVPSSLRVTAPPAGDGLPLFTDAFAGGVGSLGAGWSNEAYSGGSTPDFQLDGSGKAVQSASDDIAGFAIRAGGAGVDHAVYCDVTIPSSDLGGFRCGVVARWADNGSYIAARFLNQGSADEVEVWEHNEGVVTLVVAAQLGNLTNDATHTLEMAVVGAEVAVYMDGNIVAQGTTTLLAGTGVGFGCEDDPVAGTASYDNFAVRAAELGGAAEEPEVAGYQDLVAAQAGKVGWWKFDETSGTAAEDSVGSNDGTHSDSANSNKASLLADGTGKSALYDATRTTVADDATLQLAGSLSIEAVIKPVAIPPTGQTWVLSKDNSYGLAFHDGKLAFLIRDSLGTYNYLDAPSTGDVVVDTIYHVCGTWDDATKVQRLYIDGSLVATGSALGAGVNVNTSDMTFGSWPDGGERYSGYIDELVLYNVAVPGADIADHAAAALGG